MTNQRTTPIAQTPPFRTVLWTMIKHQPARYTLALVVWVSIWTMPVMIGLLIGYFFDQLANDIETSTVTTIVIALGVYTLVRTVLIFIGMRNHASLLFRAAAVAVCRAVTRSTTGWVTAESIDCAAAC